MSEKKVYPKGFQWSVGFDEISQRQLTEREIMTLSTEDIYPVDFIFTSKMNWLKWIIDLYVAILDSF